MPSSHNSGVFQRQPGQQLPRAQRATGCYIVDDAGRQYLDGGGGRFVNAIGYGVSAVAQALAAQAETLVHVSSKDFLSEVEQRFARALLDYVGGGFSRVWLGLSGSEANETAVKLARQYWLLQGRPEKQRILGRFMAYHGSSLGALSLTGVPARRAGFEPYLYEVPRLPAPHCYRCPLGLEPKSCGVACVAVVEERLLQLDPNTVAAIIVEPVSGGPLAGVLSPPGYLQELRAICDRHGILLIVDEVITAPARTGHPLGMDHWGVQADIASFGKGVSSGYTPIGGLLVTPKVHDVFEAEGCAFSHASSFTASPMVAAAGLAVLEEIQRQDLTARAARLGGVLASALASLRDTPLVGDIRGLGLLQGVELVADPISRRPFPQELNVAGQVYRAARQRGLIVVPNQGTADGHHGDNFMLAPPLIIDEAQIHWMVAVLGEALAEVAEGLG